MSTALTAAIAVATLVAVLTRPRGYGEGVWAMAGALLMLVTGRLPIGAAGDALRGVSGVLVFLVGLFWLALAAGRAGLFERAARLTVRSAGGNSHRLLFAVFVLGALVTALLSNDATVVLLTPVVLTACNGLRLPPLPYLFACTFVADTASSLLPISNPINVLYAEQLGIGFVEHTLLLAIPTLLAVLINAGIFHLLFRRQIPRRFDAGALPAQSGALSVVDRLILAGLAFLAVGYLVSAVTGIALYWITLGGGVLLAVTAWAGGRVTARELLRAQPPGLYAFVVGLAIVVAAAAEQGLLDALGNLVTRAGEMPELAGLVGVTLGTALGTNLVNNWTMGLAMTPALERAGASDLLMLGSLFGADSGPNLSVVGSLATLIWLAEVRNAGLAVSGRTYLTLGLAATMPALVGGVLALYLMNLLV